MPLPLPSLDTVKKAGPVAVIGLIALLLAQHVVALNGRVMDREARIDQMQDTWLQHIWHEGSCPHE